MTGLDAQLAHATRTTDRARAATLAQHIRGHPIPIVALVAALVFVCAALVVSHSDKRVSEPEQHASDHALVIAAALGDPTADDELDRRNDALLRQGELQQHNELLYPFGEPFGFPLRNAADIRLAAITRRLTAIQRMQDHASDTQFMKTPVDHALDGLALRKPPLHVLQWVLIDPSPTLDTPAQRERFFRMPAPAQAQLLIPKPDHTFYARVDREQFYAMSEHDRTAAVNGFYRDAERQFDKQSIRDFVLIVTPYTPTTEHLPAFAIGRDGSASLTPLGRTRPNPAGV